VQPRLIIFHEVETKDLCTVRYNSTSNKALLLCGFEVCQASRSSYLHRRVRLKCGSGTERMRNGTDEVKMRNGTDGVKMRNGTDMGLKCGTERIWG
jgi:hypothetical protein